MANGEGTFGMQVCFLFKLVFRLKSWKLLTFVLVIPAVFLNFLIFKNIEKFGQSDEIKSEGVTELDMKTLVANKVLIKEKTKEKATLLKIMMQRKAEAKDWVQECKSDDECKLEFVKSVISRSHSIYSIMQFGDAKSMKLFCLHDPKSQIMCPYLYNLMSQTLEYDQSVPGDRTFKDVTVAKFNDKGENEKSAGEGFPINISRPDSMCTRSTKTGTFPLMFQLYFCFHVMLITAAFILHYTVGTLFSITNLKENGFLQLVFNNGLSVGAFWLVYWIITLIEILIISVLTIVAYILMCPGYFQISALVPVFFMLIIYFLSLAALGLLFTTLQSSFFIILMIMILVQMLTCVIMFAVKYHTQLKGMVTDDEKEFDALIAKLLLLFPPAHIVEYCGPRMLPSGLPDYFNPPSQFDTYFSMLAPLIVITPFLLIPLTIYLDFIVRNGNGLCLPCGYPFNGSFWSPSRQKLIEMVDNQPRKANVEPATGIPAVIANDIVMTYPSGICEAKRPPVLRGVTCTIYQGQITALIGHNGAGKTTLIRVLMGEEIPTSGVAVINGYKVTDPYQRLALRGAVSICKQVDVLSSHLTVMESMQLTLVAKGFGVDSQVKKVLDMMRRLGLEGKENVQAMDLSGGQMRKVCSIICLLGNPKLVILDEPTSGLDPVSRRNLWQILKENRVGRSILLCTQFMDEADILADRKMFLSAGKLICAGSSMFLKQAFGCCLTMNVSLKNENQAGQLMGMLKKVKLVSQFQTELQLQVMSVKPKVLASAVQILEQNPQIVDAFGVSQAQLDDIFMRLRFIDMDDIEASFRSKNLRKLGKEVESQEAGIDKVDFSQLYNAENAKPYKATLVGQFVALMRMNFIRQWKAKTKFCFRIIFPLILTAAIIGISMMSSPDEQKKSSKGNKKFDPNEEAEKALRSKVLTNLNSTDVVRRMNHFAGICIYDKNETRNETIEQMEVQYYCSEMFPLLYIYMGVAVGKDAKVPVKNFVRQKEVRELLRLRCSRPMEEYFIITCFFVYINHWDPEIPNSERQVYIGEYENPMEYQASDANIWASHNAITYYINVALHFSAYRMTPKRNFSMANMYMVEILKGLKFQDCYELLIYVMAFSLIPVTYLNDPIEDKECGVRQHLASMGMSTMAYWVNTFILHWLHYAICLLLISIACLTVPRYQNSYFLINIVLATMLLGTITCQLSVYAASSMLKKTNAMVLVLYFFLAMFQGFGIMYFQDEYTVMLLLLCLLPPFTPVAYMFMGVKILTYGAMFFEVKNIGNIPSVGSLLTNSDIVMISLLVMPVHILILLGIIVFVENSGALLNACKKSLPPLTETPKSVKDVGVKVEADRINLSPRDNENLMEVRDLQKVYPNGVRAVRGTTFGAIAGEILGLLGPNGAGKTTTMSIIVGEETASSGVSEVNFSNTWMSGIDGAHCGAIGYCPQHNPLFNNISVLDHLSFYAQIRGLPSDLAAKQVSGLIDGLGLKPHQAKAAEQLSGGNKRRLCLAIALLGNPSLVVIDEASTGVDPENKRFIWRAIRGMASKFRSVLITTHSMEEVEALCSRVGIMNKGVMIGFGTVQQLRSRHGEAYTLDVLMKARKPQKLRLKKKKLAREIAKKFTGSTVMEDLMSCMQFNLPRKHIPSFSGALRWLIAKKKILGIKYFSLYQMSLDQVFVNLVKENDES